LLSTPGGPSTTTTTSNDHDEDEQDRGFKMSFALKPKGL
jgi:hypothetical protein